MRSLSVHILVFVGGFTVMSVEVLAGRVLAPYFGGSIHVWGSVIAVFMLALSVGYLAGGRLSLSRPSHRRLGGIFLACSASLLPLLLVADPFLDWLFVRIDDPRHGSLAASAVLFFVPTMLMGIISPYAIRLLVPTAERSGSVAGLLYFVSTAGSALGVLVTSFYFVLWFEVSSILAGLATGLAACGAIAIAPGRATPVAA